ncbi:hypothetical protein ACFC18_44125 [Streptomyces sp. NPDC056121]|uniref:hypothetical protein n=1 Tax=unclassified Streptomyces TaxID=2593676 RepID=UPI0035E39A34
MVLGRTDENGACCPGLVAAPLDDDQAAELAKLFKALGDPVRLRLIFGLARTGQARYAPVAVAVAVAVASYIGAAYWFTSSTSFANPAVTIGRAFTDTFAGIAPGSLGPFVAAQLVGAALGLGLVVAVFGRLAPVPAVPAGLQDQPEPAAPTIP